MSRAAVRSYRTSGLRRRSKSLTLHFAQMPEPDTTPMSLLSLQKSPESLTPLFSHICHSPILPLYHPLYITPCISPRFSNFQDDGYLLTLLFDGRTLLSTLLVFDAALPLSDGPIARVPLLDPAAATGATAGGGMSKGARAYVAGERLVKGLANEKSARGMASPGLGLHGTWVDGLVPSLAEVRQAELARVDKGAYFLEDPGAATGAADESTFGGEGSASSTHMADAVATDSEEDKQTPIPAPAGGVGPGATCALFLGGAFVSRLEEWATRLRARLGAGVAAASGAADLTSAATACEGLLGRLHDDALEFPEVSEAAQQGGVGFPFWARVGDVALPAPRLLPVWQRLPILPRLLPALGNAAPGAEGSERLAFQGKAGASTGGAAAAARPQGRLGAKPFALGVAAGGGLATACLITLFAASRMIRR